MRTRIPLVREVEGGATSCPHCGKVGGLVRFKGYAGGGCYTYRFFCRNCSAGLSLMRGKGMTQKHADAWRIFCAVRDGKVSGFASGFRAEAPEMYDSAETNNRVSVGLVGMVEEMEAKMVQLRKRLDKLEEKSA